MGVITMGMVGYFVSASSETLDELKNNPDEVENYLYPNDGDDELPNFLDVDKVWHGIHYMLTGSAYGGEEPLSLTVFGGEAIGEDMGYGPARMLMPQQVKAVAKALNALDEDVFRSRFAPQEMEAAEIYPDEIWVCDSQEALEDLVEGFQQLLVFYSVAAARGNGAILWIG
jgi:hypothetical protein